MYLLCFIFTLICTFLSTNSTLVNKNLTKQELEDLEMTAMEECRIKFNIDEKIIDDYFNESTTLPVTQDFKCMLTCQDERLGYVNNQVINWDLMRVAQNIYYQDYDNVEKYVEVVDNCEKNGITENEDTCDISFQITECFRKQYIEQGLEW
uniref:Putative odorant-binding protein n=1 Tax=Triatoma brasiliensis TaxID=65344 RepID=A0A163GQY3_TRIBS|nr:putative odorant-binding protein [Triatoma brasiliensis]